jgi:hypothetical protein
MGDMLGRAAFRIDTRLRRLRAMRRTRRGVEPGGHLDPGGRGRRKRGAKSACASAVSHPLETRGLREALQTVLNFLLPCDVPTVTPHRQNRHRHGARTLRRVVVASPRSPKRWASAAQVSTRRWQPASDCRGRPGNARRYSNTLGHCRRASPSPAAGQGRSKRKARWPQFRYFSL